MTATTMLPSLQCPFCSSTSVRLIECDINHFAVCCDDCLAIDPTAETNKRATNTWNSAPRTTRLQQPLKDPK